MVWLELQRSGIKGGKKSLGKGELGHGSVFGNMRVGLSILGPECFVAHS